MMKTDFCFVTVVAIVLGSSCQIPAMENLFILTWIVEMAEN